MPTEGTGQLRTYSADRESLTQELRETLRRRGYWCPETSGPDLINAVAMALDSPSEAIDKPQQGCYNEGQDT